MSKLLPLAALLALGGGCMLADDSPCEQAAAYISDCTGSVPDGFAETCDDRTAETVMSLSCDAIAGDAKGDGKNDGAIGWKDQGDSCSFNFQCSGELVCRPTNEDSGTLGINDEFCLERGTFGDFCDADADCEGELKCIGDAIVGGDNGFCRQPLG